MFEIDADKFRKKADEAREQASKAISPLDQEAWLRIAEEWLKLAQNAEMRAKKYGRLSWRPLSFQAWSPSLSNSGRARVSSYRGAEWTPIRMRL